MKKSKIISLLLVGLLAFGAGLGTFALFSTQVSSDGNTFDTARFEIRPIGKGGSDFQTKQFEVKDMHPLQEGGSSEFTVVKNNETIKTGVPVEYTISINGDGNLFESPEGYTSPIKFKLERKNSNNEFVVVCDDVFTQSYTLSDVSDDQSKIPADVEEFRISYEWNSITNENDTFYAGKSGNIDINFNAIQVELPPIPKNIATVSHFMTWCMSKASPRGHGPTDIYYYKNADGLKVIELYDIEESNHVIGDMKMVQSSVGSTKYSIIGGLWDGKTFNMTYKELYVAYEVAFTDVETRYPLNPDDQIKWSDQNKNQELMDFIKE